MALNIPSATGSAPSFQGYACGTCNTFIPLGSFHQCGGSPQSMAASRDQQIIDRLDKIIRLLEAK